jgi:hypothetical protein
LSIGGPEEMAKHSQINKEQCNHDLWAIYRVVRC